MTKGTITALRLLAAAAVLAATPAASWAQAASQVTATATVSNYSAVSGSGDLAFGTLDRATDNVISATGGQAATRSVNFNHNIRVTFVNVPTNLTSPGGAVLPVALTCAARLGAGTWSTPAACGSAQLDLDVGSSVASATLGFGGAITAAATSAALAGSYSGTFDIVITAR